MKSMANPKDLLAALEQERAELLHSLRSLNEQIAILDKMIIRQKAILHGTSGGEKVTRKNLDRLFAESKILEVLEENRHGLAPARVGQLLQEKGLSLKSATLRSHLRRMLDSGKVVRKGGLYRPNANQ